MVREQIRILDDKIRGFILITVGSALNYYSSEDVPGHVFFNIIMVVVVSIGSFLLLREKNRE